MNISGFIPLLLKTSFEASFLIIAIFTVNFLFSKKLPARMKYMLYFLVVLRLAMVSVPCGPNIFRIKKEMPEKAVQQITLILQKTPESAEIRKASVPMATISSEDQTKAFPYMDLLFCLWGAGAAAMAFFTISRILNFRQKYIKTSHPVCDNEILSILYECRMRMGIKQKIALSYSPLGIPVLCGIFRPKILLPENCRIPLLELRYIFLHELSHVKSCDLFFNCLFQAIKAVHWFNPLVFLMFRKMNESMEEACDESLLARIGEKEKISYGETLVNMAERLSFGALSVPVLSIINKKSNLERRIKMIVNFKRRPPILRLLAGILLIGTGFGVLAENTKQVEPQKNPCNFIKAEINFTENGKTVSAPRIIMAEGSTAVIRMGQEMYFTERWLPPVIKDNKSKEASPELSKTPTDIGLSFEITPTICAKTENGKEVKGIFLNCKAVVSDYTSSNKTIYTIDSSTSVFPVFVPLAELNTPVKIPLKYFNKQYEAEILLTLQNPDGTNKI